MHYNYDARMDELQRVVNIGNESVKIRALARFIQQEIQILTQLDIPQNRSRALDRANSSLHRMLHPVQSTSACVRQLFPQ